MRFRATNEQALLLPVVLLRPLSLYRNFSRLSHPGASVNFLFCSTAKVRNLLSLPTRDSSCFQRLLSTSLGRRFALRGLLQTTTHPSLWQACRLQNAPKCVSSDTEFLCNLIVINQLNLFSGIWLKSICSAPVANLRINCGPFRQSARAPSSPPQLREIGLPRKSRTRSGRCSLNKTRFARRSRPAVRDLRGIQG